MSKPESLSQILAENRTEMGFDRTIMAYDRTLMAWIRTTLSLISFGFTIFKFLDTMQKAEGKNIRENAPRDLGIFLILIGMTTLLMAVFQYKKAVAKVEAFSKTKPPVSLSVAASYGVFLVGVAMLLNMFIGDFELEETVKRVMDNLIDRVSGPMHFRVVLQPLMASIFAIIAGIKDAKTGKPAYFWALFAQPEDRPAMLREAWKSVGKIFVIAVILDIVYQLIEQKWVYSFEVLLVAFLFAIVPYVILRGPVNRLASLFIKQHQKAA